MLYGTGGRINHLQEQNAIETAWKQEKKVREKK